METQKSERQFEHNPITRARHRREVFWQITLPLLVGIILLLAVLAAILFSASQTSTEVERWADVSLIWLILPSLAFALILLVITAGLVYLISYLMRLIPGYAFMIQKYFELARGKLSQLANMLTKPIVRLNEVLAGTSHALYRLRHLLK